MMSVCYIIANQNVVTFRLTNSVHLVNHTRVIMTAAGADYINGSFVEVCITLYEQ